MPNTFRIMLIIADPTIGLPGQPLSLKQISISSSMINITWDPPIDIGDGIKGYTVKWQEVNGTSGSMQKVVPLLSFNSASLTVTPYTWYDIHVQAYNDEGIGPWSKPLRVQSSESGEFNTKFCAHGYTLIVIFF